MRLLAWPSRSGCIEIWQRAAQEQKEKRLDSAASTGGFAVKKMGGCLHCTEFRPTLRGVGAGEWFEQQQQQQMGQQDDERDGGREA